MESAMKPMAFTSGTARARASAALVDVRMMLSRTERDFLRSFAPALGTLSRTLCEFVAAWTVEAEAVRIARVFSWSTRGLIIWARAVVVQEAAETRECRSGSKAR